MRTQSDKKAGEPENPFTIDGLRVKIARLEAENEWLRKELRLVQGGHIEALEEWGKALGGE